MTTWNNLRRSNTLTEFGLREAMANIVALDAACQLEAAIDECREVHAENEAAYRQRTLGQEMKVDDLAGTAARLLGVPESRCLPIAIDLLFPNRAMSVASVLRAWAKDIKPPRRPAR